MMERVTLNGGLTEEAEGNSLNDRNRATSYFLTVLHPEEARLEPIVHIYFNIFNFYLPVVAVDDRKAHSIV